MFTIPSVWWSCFNLTTSVGRCQGPHTLLIGALPASAAPERLGRSVAPLALPPEC